MTKNMKSIITVAAAAGVAVYLQGCGGSTTQGLQCNADDECVQAGRGQYCYDGICGSTKPCTTENDCAGGQTCHALGYCATACSTSSECPTDAFATGAICREGVCLSTCQEERDCVNSFSCMADVCIPTAAAWRAIPGCTDGIDTRCTRCNSPHTLNQDAGKCDLSCPLARCVDGAKGCTECDTESSYARCKLCDAGKEEHPHAPWMCVESELRSAEA